MNTREKVLYHQVHPAKLLTDWGTTPPALYLLWRHRLIPGLLIAFVPPVIASYAVMRYADLEKYERSGVGEYLREYMTPAMQGMRLAGAVVTMVGAWFHRPWLIPVGLAIVLLAWARGLILPRKSLKIRGDSA